MYEETIRLLVTKYHESDLVNDHRAIHPECPPIQNDNLGDVHTSFLF
jgi:hypothetical protein